MENNEFKIIASKHAEGQYYIDPNKHKINYYWLKKFKRYRNVA